MRIYLHLTPNTEIVPFNYQAALVGAFHKWLGENELHDDISLYSLSWLGPAHQTKHGFNFPRGSIFFISSPLEDLHQKLVSGVFNRQHIRWGMSVHQAQMKTTPDFGGYQRFMLQSPVLIKRRVETEKQLQYFYPSDPESNGFMTETLQKKLQKFGLDTDVSVRFDPNYKKPGIKKVTFNNIDIKASYCPVIVEGDPQAVAFAWDVGVGNSTGIGFGALK
jgi:CRISPR-associated endoribonuclease Cas6